MTNKKLAFEIVKLVIGDNKKAMMELGLQLMEHASGARKRFHAGKTK